MTMPPEWMPRWRGKSSSSAASVPHQRREVVPFAERLAPVDRLRPCVHLLGGVPEGLAHVAQGRARPVGDHVGHLGGVQPAVALVDVLDDLLAPARLDVDVDVRRSVAGRGEEAFEQQAEGDGVDVGDAEGVTDRRGGRRSPTLAEDVLVPAERDDVPDGEEVAGEPERADDGQLAVELGPGPRHPLGLPRPVPVGGPPADQLDQPGLLGVPGRHREVGEPRGHQAQVEGAPGGDLRRPVDHPGPPGEPPSLLGLAAQAGGGRRGEPPFEIGEGPPGPHRGQRGGQGEPGRGGVVHVVGGHRGHPPLGGQQGQGVVAGGVDRVAVVPQLDGQVVAAEPPDQVVEHLGRGRRPPGGEGGGQGPLAAPGEDLPVPAVVIGQRVEGDDRLPLLPAGQVGLGDHPAEAGVPLGVPGQHDQVGAVGVGHPGPDLATPAPAMVSSAPKTVGRPKARAASAKRTTP